jgi:hypothetical protein
MRGFALEKEHDERKHQKGRQGRNEQDEAKRQLGLVH